jgi:hypothetical protein
MLCITKNGTVLNEAPIASPEASSSISLTNSSSSKTVLEEDEFHCENK